MQKDTEVGRIAMAVPVIICILLKPAEEQDSLCTSIIVQLGLVLRPDPPQRLRGPLQPFRVNCHPPVLQHCPHQTFPLGLLGMLGVVALDQMLNYWAKPSKRMTFNTSNQTRDYSEKNNI